MTAYEAGIPVATPQVPYATPMTGQDATFSRNQIYEFYYDESTNIFYPNYDYSDQRVYVGTSSIVYNTVTFVVPAIADRSPLTAKTVALIAGLAIAGYEAAKATFSAATPYLVTTDLGQWVDRTIINWIPEKSLETHIPLNATEAKECPAPVVCPEPEACPAPVECPAPAPAPKPQEYVTTTYDLSAKQSDEFFQKCMREWTAYPWPVQWFNCLVESTRPQEIKVPV